MKNTLIVLLILFCSCYKPEPDIEYFAIRNDWITLPCKVYGNIFSDTFILYLDQFGLNGILQEIKNQYAIVEFDYNRCYGFGENCEKGDYNTQHVIADIDLVVKVLSERYGENINIYLYGRGLGASLAIQYANLGVYKKELNGIIVNHAMINYVNAAKASKFELLKIINDKIDNEISKSYLDMLKPMNINDSNTSDEYYKFFIHNYFYNDEFQLFDLVDVFPDCVSFNEIDTPPLSINKKDYYHRHDYRQLVFEDLGFIDLDIANNISGIGIPVSLNWHRDALIVPLSVGEEIFKLLETPEKELNVFEDPCIPYFDESGVYTQKVIEFIEKYK